MVEKPTIASNLRKSVIEIKESLSANQLINKVKLNSRKKNIYENQMEKYFLQSKESNKHLDTTTTTTTTIPADVNTNVRHHYKNYHNKDDISKSTVLSSMIVHHQSQFIHSKEILQQQSFISKKSCWQNEQHQTSSSLLLQKKRNNLLSNYLKNVANDGTTINGKMKNKKVDGLVDDEGMYFQNIYKKSQSCNNNDRCKETFNFGMPVHAAARAAYRIEKTKLELYMRVYFC